MGRKLAKNVYVGETLHLAGSEPDKDAAEQITNPAAWDQEAAAVDDGDYESLGVKALQAEVDKRNADRDEDAQIEPASKKKADLVAALEADDAVTG